MSDAHADHPEPTSPKRAPETPTVDARAAVGAAVAAALCVAAVLLLAGFLYLLPDGFFNEFGVGRREATHYFAAAAHRPRPEIGIPQFQLGLRLLLTAAWAAYGAFLYLAGRCPGTAWRWRLPVVMGVPLLVAVVCPPALSNDIYAYLAYARLGVLYGENPYLQVARRLADFQDPVSHYYVRPVSTIYGPVWTLVTYGVVFLLRSCGLWWQVLAIKLLAGLSVTGAALAARRIAERYSPGYGEAASLAVVLNPLFLVEGPGHGHNDLFMAGLLLAGIACWAEGRPRRATLLVGLSAGVKFITLGLAPWLWIEQARRGRLPAALIQGLVAAGLALLPIVVFYTPFWAGAATFAGFRSQLDWDTDAAARAQNEQLMQWWTAHGAPHFAGSLAVLLRWQWPALVLYLVLTFWVWRSRAEAPFMAAWIVFAAWMARFSPRILWFPWYFVWPFSVALCRWDPLYRRLAAGCAVMAYLLMLSYTMQAGVP
jgi:Glycosyltransferase family 87